MSSPSANPDSTVFFEHWAIYRKVVEHNYMGHDEIELGLRDLLTRRKSTKHLLDLGCGDAELPSRYLPHLDLTEYHGVDLAQQPLDFARQKLDALPAAIHLHQADQASFPAQTEHRFDVAVLGFALHHSNPIEEKAGVLAAVKDCLKPGGEVLVYDVFRPHHEDRPAFFNRYLDWIHRDWTRMTAHEHDLIDAHIRENDYPEPVDSLLQLARDAGFAKAEEHLSAAAGFHHLLRFQT
jgi:SAM-dependent methyltransferase